MKNRKPLLASLLAAAMLITSAPLGILAPASAAEVQNDYELTYSSNGYGTCAVIDCTGDPAVVDIPEFSPDGDKVTEIGEKAFGKCSSLTKITIPESVTEIGYRAFEKCTNLANINIPEGVTSIGRYVFEGCSSLANVTIPESVTEIGDGAFNGCSSLTNITIPNNVISIESYTFYGCSILTKVTIPEGVTEIGEYAFAHCSRLTNITIPESVTKIEGWAFLECSRLTDITIPENVTSIGNCTFEYCSNLKTVTIHEGVTSFGVSAFSNCTNLTNITIPESVASIGELAFSGCSRLNDITILSPFAIFEDKYARVLPDFTTIHGYKDSTAEEYSTRRDNPFVPLDETNKFSTPEITQDQTEDGTPVNAIAVEEGELAAYANNRAHEDGSFDLRIILAENAVIQNGEKLTLSFYRDGSPEAYIISRTVADEYVAGKTAKTYDQVIAAGETYAAGGSGTLFGFVVTGIPAGGFDSATLTVTAADGSVIAATQFTYATVAPQA